jgi:hypothetical protein
VQRKAPIERVGRDRAILFELVLLGDGVPNKHPINALTCYFRTLIELCNGIDTVPRRGDVAAELRERKALFSGVESDSPVRGSGARKRDR